MTTNSVVGFIRPEVERAVDAAMDSSVSWASRPEVDSKIRWPLILGVNLAALSPVVAAVGSLVGIPGR